MTRDEQKAFMVIVDEVLDSDELYDLLPGDGEDDYIIGKIRQLFKDAIA